MGFRERERSHRSRPSCQADVMHRTPLYQPEIYNNIVLAARLACPEDDVYLD